jgi:ribose transport system permease protein
MTPDKTEASMASAGPPSGSAAAADGTAPPDGAAAAGAAAPAGEGAAATPGGPGVAGGAPASGTMRAMRRRGTSLLQRYSLVALLGISIGVYGIWGKTSAVFLTAADFRNIASSQAVLVVLTLGLIIPMISGSLDLSIGNAAGLSSVATAAFYAHGHVPLLVGVVLGIAVGAVIGVGNGLLVVLLRVDSFIITLGTASVIFGLVIWYTGGQSIVLGIPQSLLSFGGGKLIGIPDSVYVVTVVALLVWYLLEQTPFGRSLHAVGSNKAAARLVGIRVERVTFAAFVLSGAFAGLAGVLLLASSGAGNPQIGQQFTLTAVAAAFLGAASFKVGRLNVLGSIVAILFLAVNITGLTFAGVADWINQLFTGVALVVAIAFATALHRERRHRTRSTAQDSP